MNARHSPVSLSLLIFGVYALVMGLVLLFVPEQVLPLFGFVESGGTWVHVLGFVLCCSAYYYLFAGYVGNNSFARLTTHTRIASPLVMLALFALDMADGLVLLFGIVDALGGIWTWALLRREGAGPRHVKITG